MLGMLECKGGATNLKVVGHCNDQTLAKPKINIESIVFRVCCIT